MSQALRYALRHHSGAITVAVAQGAVSRVQLPDPQSKSRFVAAVAKARCDNGEELEMLGEVVGRLRQSARLRLLRRIGVLSPSVTLISSLNAWENISLPAAYHGSPSLEQVAQITQEVLADLVGEPRALLERLPHQLGTLQRRIVAFVRLLVMDPDLAVIDGLEEGLSREECANVARFEALYRARHPGGTLLFVDIEEEDP